MKKLIPFLLLLVAYVAQAKTYTYKSVANDPLNARIYTLENGLKVYLSAYHNEPRIQANITVKVGGKNDPAETTGLAHYFEHLMFKGTSQFGTSDYEKEKPLLDQIEQLFEVYRNSKDDDERKKLYRTIDSVSGVAAQYAIANEYDKLMKAIGSTGTNAWTSNDATSYIENIPANQLENWAKVQLNRFSDPVIRLFHTELETVYEEKNMSLTNDNRKLYEAMMRGLFPQHPYGKQTVLGTQEHLKNPSIINIKKYFETYYIPNNMAITLAGDFNPDSAIVIIDKYFGQLKRKPLDIKPLVDNTVFAKEVVDTVYGLEAERIALAFRFAGASSSDATMIKLLDMVLMNGKAGIIDLNVVQKQKLTSASCSVLGLTDYQALLLTATPKQGQTLEEAKQILLAQVASLKRGEFEDWLLKAIVTDFKRMTIQGLESNAARAGAMARTFVDGLDWESSVKELDEMAKVTKAQLVDFANKHLSGGYVAVYKKEGKDPNEMKIDKPAITPVKVNRDAESEFLSQIKNSKVVPIEPIFLDFKKDLTITKTKKSNIEILYKQNVDNELFELIYVLDMGGNHDKELPLAVGYLRYLGTDKYTAEQIKEEFYKLGCSFNVSSSAERVYVSLSGLGENMTKSLSLFEHLLAKAKVDTTAYANLVDDILKGRGDAKLRQGNNFSALTNYATYGSLSPSTNILSEQQLRALKPEVLVKKVQTLTSYQHRIFYYGSAKESELISLLGKYHKTPSKLAALPEETKFTELPTTEPKVLFAQYDAKQVYFSMMSKLGGYDKKNVPILRLYNEYFGGSMNAIVFQEMREARGLAYMARATYSQAARLDRSNYMRTLIATQADKLNDAVTAFHDILNNMPLSEPAFLLAQEGIVQRLRTERIHKSSVLWAYDAAQKMGLDYDIRRDIFEKVPTFTLNDVKEFQEKNVKNLPYTYCILGDESAIDKATMEKLGKVQKLTQEQIFGY
ncbi:MAG: M16 family metallopeptidase [Bacteroidales bacterium]